MRSVFKFILAPLLLVLLVEGLFQAGAWEYLARPDSHPGQSIQLKRALADPAYAHIDFVTLGSSRPVYGIDHEALAELAQKHGAVHADLSMPGSHWMTIRILTRWLARHHPEIRGGVIALSAQDLLFVGNGSYELGIVHPFHRLDDIPLMATHVPIDRADPATWAVFSALFQYREDVQDFVSHPEARQENLAWWKARTADMLLRENAHATDDMCDFGLDSLAACVKAEAGSSDQAKALQRQCVELRNAAKTRADLGALSRQTPPPVFLQRTSDSVHATLRALNWRRPPVVILMPTPRVWQEEISPIGLRERALAVLQPLVADGTIRLIDATQALENDGRTDCKAFFDFYHQNETGRARLMQTLLPQIESMLYDGTPPRTAAFQ